MFPISSSLTRRLASLHRIARGFASPASSVPSRRSDFLPSLSPDSLLVRPAIPRTAAAHEEAGSCRLPAPYRNCAGASILFLRPRSWRQGRTSQVPGQPLREHALLFDPGGLNASGHYDTLSVAFRPVDNVGSAIGHLSRLNHTACSLAVYASWLGLLRSHHARLASRWRPTLAGQDLNLLGCFRRFLSVMSLHITSIPLRQALPGAPTDVTPSRWR